MIVYYGCSGAIPLYRAIYERRRSIGILHQSVWYFQYLRKIIPIIWLGIELPTYFWIRSHSMLVEQRVMHFGLDCRYYPAPVKPTPHGWLAAFYMRLGYQNL